MGSLIRGGKMKHFKIERSLYTKEAVWRRDIRYWLMKCKKVSKPTESQINMADKLLNSGDSLKDIQSFCKLTGWKWRGSRSSMPSW